MEIQNDTIKQLISKYNKLNSKLSIEAVQVQDAINKHICIGWIKIPLLWMAAKTLKKKGAFSVLNRIVFILAGFALSRPGLWEYIITCIGGNTMVGSIIVSIIKWYDGTIDYFVIVLIFIYGIFILILEGLESWYKYSTRKEYKALLNAITFNPSEKWFDDKCNSAINSLGERYSPEKNFINPKLSNVYQALISPDYWSLDFKNALKAFLVKANKDYHSLDTDYQESHKEIKTNIDSIVAIFNYKTSKRFGELFTLTEKIIDSYSNLRYYHHKAYSDYDFSVLNDLYKTMYNYKSLCQFINNPVIYIKGVAGTGKSHLIADIVSERISKGHKSILLLGLNFTDMTDIRERIKSILSIKGTWDDFLKTINEIARKDNDRIVFFVDGINEGIGEKLWKHHISEFESDILQYDYLGLVVSARTFVKSNILDEVSNGKATIELEGFKGMEDRAFTYLAGKFGIALPNISHHLRDFSNPLFLLLYIKSYDDSLPSPASFLDIAYSYLIVCNKRLSSKYGYESTLYDYVTEAVRVLSDLYVRQVGYKEKWKKADEYIKALSEKLPSSIDASYFVQDLIKEGIFMMYSDRNAEKLIDFNFDLVGDYICAEALINAGWSQYDGSVTYEGIYEATSVLLPVLKGVEFYEYNNSNINSSIRHDYFLKTLNQRFSLSQSALENLENLRLNNSDAFLECLPNVASFKECNELICRFNVSMKGMSMQERDAKYAMFYTLGCDGINHTNLVSLARWAVSISRESAIHLSDLQAFQCSSVLCWSFSIPYKALRDLSTKAVINLLRDKAEVLMSIIELFDDVNDPYIQQRLYAIVHGCVFRGNCNLCSGLAEMIYNKVFNVVSVRPDILLRDYARCSIDRIIQNSKINIDIEKITPPYNSTFSVEHCPTREYIEKKYRINESGGFTREEVYAQNRILGSMETEYSDGTGGYGDFGRYVFESAIDSWRGNIPNFASLVRNYAVDLIFKKYGYDTKVYARHDHYFHRSRGDQNTIERFGKKYQWIALYEVLGLLTDNYTMDSDVSNDKDITCPGSWNPHVRDIDTTTTYYRTDEESLIRDNRLNWTTVKTMPFEIKEPDKWLHSKEGLSIDAIKQCIEVKEISDTWVVLHSYNTLLKGSDDISLDDNEDGLWVFVQAYVCPLKEQKELRQAILKKGTRGRCVPEYSGSFYQLFYKDYYSSISYKDYSKLTKLEEWEIFEGSNATFQISYYPYSSEGEISFYRLNHLLYDVLELSDGERDGEYVDKTGKVIAFDPSVNYKNESQLLVRKEYLVTALSKYSLQLVWPILCEKQKGIHLIGNQFGGVAYYDKQFKLKVKLRPYIDKPVDYRKKAKQEYFKTKTKLVWYFVTFQKEKYINTKSQLFYYKLHELSRLHTSVE